MNLHKICKTPLLALLLFALSSLQANAPTLPVALQKIMNQSKYDTALWGLYVKDLETQEILYDLNATKLFSPGSTTKLFTTEALLATFGDDWRFKTPIYALGTIKNGELVGNLVLVASGDLTMGGREPNPNTINFTKFDHVYANSLPGVILTKEDPLHGINELAKQVHQKGIKAINGDVLIDTSLFEESKQRGMTLSPIFINENLIDIVVNPSEIGEAASITWRPEVPGYTVNNQVKTVASGSKLELVTSSDITGHNITITGTIPADQNNIVRTSTIKDPAVFARSALIQALQQQGIKVNATKEPPTTKASYNTLEPVALWTSPPLTEYAKLILKVSHNLGADLVPMLLAAHHNKKTFDEGMLLLGQFTMKKIKLSAYDFVFNDAAGGNENRLTPKAEVELLEHVYKKSKSHFTNFYEALPILGIDGSLADVAKNSDAVGQVYAKPGTGISFNNATGNFFLITQALAGYIKGKNGHTYAYMVVVNNAKMPAIDDIFAIFEDQGQISAVIYDETTTK